MQTTNLVPPGILTDVVRVQTYAEGSPTLMHLRMRDGSLVAIVREDVDFSVTLMERDGSWAGSRWVAEEAIPAALHVLLSERRMLTLLAVA